MDQLRAQWATFWTRGRTVAVAAAALAVIMVGLVAASGTHMSCGDAACTAAPTGPNGEAVSDTFAFVHRPLDENGSITVRMTALTGIITYPPPDHDEIVSGLVPWAKGGLIVKANLTQGSSYAALMVTGQHGVRMQYDYTHDLAGSDADSRQWLRLARAGDVITGYESHDGTRWAKVGVARLSGLPATVQVGMFATSPGDLTVVRVALGAGLPQSRFTQASATFDNVQVTGSPGSWRTDLVGEMGRTGWEKYHRAPGVVESNGAFTVTGSGDIGPMTAELMAPDSTLGGLAVGLAVLLVVAVRFGRSGARHLIAKTTVMGAAGFLAGLVSAGVVLPVGMAILRTNGVALLPLSAMTGVRVVLGVAVLFALASVLALALGAWLRRAWLAILVAMSTVVLPYLLAVAPLFSESVAAWLVRITPAAGFAVKQTLRHWDHVVGYYAPLAGYFPLAWWAGLLVLCGYAAVALTLARRTAP